MLQPLWARWAYGSGTDAHPERARQELMRTLSIRISSWRACSACVWVPDPYAQRAHKGRSMCVRNSIFSKIFKVPKTAQILKNRYCHQHMVPKASKKKKFFVQTQKKSVLKIRLSIRVRNFGAQNEPLNIIKTNFYFNPTVAPHRYFMV